jgi:hypothetical protein
MALLLSGEALGLFREWYEGRRRARTKKGRGGKGKAKIYADTIFTGTWMDMKD